MTGWESRPPSELLMGNGKLLVTLDAIGEVEQIFAPHIDATHSRIGVFRNFVVVPNGDAHPTLIPIIPEEFDARVRLASGSQVLQAEYHHKGGQCKLVRQIGLHPMEPMYLDSWQVIEGNVGILHRSIPWMGHATSAHCSLFHPTYNGVVHHRGRRWLGVMARSEVQWVRVGHLSDEDRLRMWNGERIYAPMGAGDIGAFPRGAVRHGWDQVVQGPATWGALASGPASKIEFFVICAESERHLGDLLARNQNIDTERFLQMIDGVSSRRHQPAAETIDRIKNPRVRSLAEKSIDVLHALQDAETGALIAAAEVDPHSRVSGGYGYCWPRDGAYLTAALDAFGFHDRVEHFFRFMASTQDPSGAWWQRYLVTGHAGPSWGRIQIDEPASVIVAAYLHYRTTQDLFWLERIWPSLEKGLAFLEDFHKPEHPLGQPSHDLWEERMGIHAYSLGAVAAAFSSAAYLAGELSNHKAQAHYQEWSKALSTIIGEKFFPSGSGVRRSFVVHGWDYQQGGGYWDETPDVSMLGLIAPFSIFKKRDVAAQRILDSVRKTLWSQPVGGVLRYTGDHYRGGNPWILTTLWLGMVELSLNNWAEARECFQWVLSKATTQGMLAEQVHKESGKPCWVIPLGWSHAMFLLFVKEVLHRNAEKEIWENV